jgi:hypothetical protein
MSIDNILNPPTRSYLDVNKIIHDLFATEMRKIGSNYRPFPKALYLGNEEFNAIMSQPNNMTSTKDGYSIGSVEIIRVNKRSHLQLLIGE